MELFNNYKIKRNNNGLKLYADFIVVFEHQDEEDVLIGTPKCWDDTFLNRIDINSYDIYFLCARVIPCARVNRITDYKKIWGVYGVEPGVYDNQYDIESGRVYFGIIKASGSNGFRQNASNFVLLTPKNYTLKFDDIFKCFANAEYNFKDNDMPQALITQINEVAQNSILLHYRVSPTPTICLSVYGHDVQRLFDEQDILQWENCDTVSVGKGFVPLY